MKKAHTILSGKFEVIDKRICEKCNVEVPVIRVKTEYREETVSECLTCDSSDLQKNIQDQIEHNEKNRHVTLFNKYSIVPDDIRNARFSNFKPGDHPSKLDAKRTAMKYVQEFEQVKDSDQNSLLFQGSYGLGKSHLAHSIATELIKKGFNVIYIDVPQLLQLFRDNIKTQSVNEQDIMRTIANSDLIILDDLGAEYIKKENGKESWAVDKLFQVLNSRNSKPKVVTTNYKPQGLRDKYGIHGGRILSRMMMGTKVVSFDGSDHRLRALN